METDRAPTPRQRTELKSQIMECFRLKEDFRDFYSEARCHRHYQWIPRMRVGRLLRAPTVFEDVIKMMCTTNCSWALTQNMVGNLVTKLGSSVDSTHCSFPAPAVIADVSEAYIRKHIKAGYRSPFLLEFARNVAQRTIDVESWRTSTLSTEELYNKVLAVKGIGAYAAGNIMKLLGRYDYLGLDSWVRKQFAELLKNGRKTSDASIEKYYRSYAKWRGLFFWLEMTRPWYEKEFPF